MMALRNWIFALLVCMSGLAAAQTEDPEREGGILGTGIRDTGIIGTITHLGSIIVNEQRIRFAPDLPIVDGVSVVRADGLLPGHIVAVIAARDGQDWQAVQIRQVVALAGPLQVSDDGGLRVLGTRVLYDGEIGELRQGDWVIISGLWRSDQVIATRIEAATGSGNHQARIEGSILTLDEDAPLRVGTTQILGLRPRHLDPGDVVRITGTPQADGIAVATLETGVFDAAPGVILAEGYLSPPQEKGLYTVLGANIVSFTDNPGMIDPLVRQLACETGGQLAAMIARDEPGDVGFAELSECLPQDARE